MTRKIQIIFFISFEILVTFNSYYYQFRYLEDKSQVKVYCTCEYFRKHITVIIKYYTRELEPIIDNTLRLTCTDYLVL